LANAEVIARRPYLSIGRHRQVHQVDRGYTSHQSNARTAIKFFDGITCRFGVPHSIITDNGTNFASKEFHEFFEKLGIKLSFASVSHPQTNGEVERITV
jgi:transposase InsO family protein